MFERSIKTLDRVRAYAAVFVPESVLVLHCEVFDIACFFDTEITPPLVSVYDRLLADVFTHHPLNRFRIPMFNNDAKTAPLRSPFNCNDYPCALNVVTAIVLPSSK